MIEVSEEFLQCVLGTPVGEITEALKDGEELKAQSEIEAWLKSKFDEQFYRAKKSGNTEGYGRGQRESLTAKEKELKEKFGVEGKTIEEVIDNVMESVKKNTTENPDDIRQSKVFVEETKRLKQIIAEKESELSNSQSKFEKTETFREVQSLGMELLKGDNFVLPDDEKISKNLFNVIINNLEDENTKIQKSGDKIVVLDANGRPKENASGTKDISFEEHFKDIAKRFLKQAVADDRKSPANKNQDAQKGEQPSTLPEINSKQDLLREMNKTVDPKVRTELKALYDKQVEDGVIKD